MDYLPIQASSVPCERAFSSASETDTRRRNRIRPELMEMIQMLKNMYTRSDFDMMVDQMTTGIAMHSNITVEDDDYLLRYPEDTDQWGDAIVAVLREDDPDVVLL